MTNRSHDSHVTPESYDNSQAHFLAIPEEKNSSSAFRSFLNIGSAPSPRRDAGNPILNSSLKASDKQCSNDEDPNVSWPSTSPDNSFTRQSMSPIREIQAKNRTSKPNKDLSEIRTQSDRPVSSGLKRESPSPKFNKEQHHFRSAYSRQKDGRWPPNRKDQAISPPIFRERRRLPSPNRDYDSFSLPDLSVKPIVPQRNESFPNSVTAFVTKVSNVPSSSAVTSNGIVSTLTDTSSTLTSTVTSPPPTQRDFMTPRSDDRIFELGHTPPVRDSGSSLTTVTPLTDQPTNGNAPDGVRDGTPDWRRFSFDLGFLDILTIDSNSSIGDQLSTGRVSELFYELYYVVMECFCKRSNFKVINHSNIN